MIPRWRLVVVVVGVVAAAIGTGCGSSSTGEQQNTAGNQQSSTRTVVRVVDGDTIVVDGGERVRFIGIDTPETVKPNTPVQCFGREASDYTKSLLPSGTAVRLEYDVRRTDRYDRTLAYVYRDRDNLFVNADLVRNGYANVSTVPPNVARADEFVALAREARAANRGLYSRCS